MRVSEWREGQFSRGADILQSKMQSALSTVYFESKCQELLECCLIYLPDDLCPFLIEAIQKKISTDRQLCPPRDQLYRVTAWLDNSPVRELFVILGERYARRREEIGNELERFLIDSLQEPDLLETATKSHEMKMLMNPDVKFVPKVEPMPPHLVAAMTERVPTPCEVPAVVEPVETPPVAAAPAAVSPTQPSEDGQISPKDQIRGQIMDSVNARANDQILRAEAEASANA